MGEFGSSQDDELSEKTRQQYIAAYTTFHKWREERPLSDELVARYVHVYVKGSEHFPGEHHGTDIEKHRVSTARVMLCFVKKDLEHHHRFYLSDRTFKEIEDYFRAKERKELVKQAPVMSDDEIQKVIALEEDTPTKLRDKLIFLIGTATLGRSVEISALLVQDILFEKGGFFVHIERRKTERNGAQQKIFVEPYFFDYPLKERLQKYISYLPPTGPLWCSISRGSHPRVVGALAASTVREAINRLAKRAGLSKHFTSHSMRRTGTTRMADAGCSVRQIQAMGNWKSPTVAERYVEHSMLSVKGCAKAITTPQECVTLVSGSCDETSAHKTADKLEATDTTDSYAVEPRSKVPRRCVYNFNAPVHNVYFVCNPKDTPQTEDWTWPDVFMNKQAENF